MRLELNANTVFEGIPVRGFLIGATMYCARRNVKFTVLGYFLDREINPRGVLGSWPGVSRKYWLIWRGRPATRRKRMNTMSGSFRIDLDEADSAARRESPGAVSRQGV